MTPFRFLSRAGSIAIICATMSGAAVLSARASDAEAEQRCSADAMRLCMSEIPDRDRITACMSRKRAQLSPGCQAMFNEPRTATIRKASRVP